MAEKRMFTMKIVDSDTFKEMPLSAQALYFHLGMNADDEGFLNNAKSVQRSIMASDDDMKLLIAKNFIIPFDSGIVVIKHWKMHNTIQPSRIKPTQYIEEKNLLTVKENKAYTLIPSNADRLPTNCQQIVSTCCQNGAEIRLEEIRLDKCSVVEGSAVDVTPTEPTPLPAPPTPTHTPSTYDDLVSKYGKAFVDERVERAKKYRNCNMSTVAKWCEEDFKNPAYNKANSFNSFPQRQYNMDEVEHDLLKRQVKENDDP